ncbi:hypothetical protein [Natronosalvus caseinilyticus]|uniref:hypothetical protein n=1 Tax=Natronosalvus caseinilyticus TaxID=2953747 RepID=UPI0028A9B4BE|nr:hypothetical protein [Natronosalvus caseinilyticus]
MNIEDVEEFLDSFDPLHRNGAIEEEPGDITATVKIGLLRRGQVGSLLSNILAYPDLVTDCSIDVNADGYSKPLFHTGRRGIDLSDDGFEELAKHSSIQASSYKTEIAAHDRNNRVGELVFNLVSLLWKVHDSREYEIDFSVLINKNEILDVWVSNKENWTVVPDRLNQLFWYDISNLSEWLAEHSFTEGPAGLFDPEKMPVLVYYENRSDRKIHGTIHFPVFQLSATPDLLSSQFDSYRSKMSVTKDNTSYFHNAPIITPSLFASSESLRILFNDAFLYSMFAVFSDKVVTASSEFRFYAEYGPNALDDDPVDIDCLADDIAETAGSQLAELYQEFSRRENRTKFVEFWRQSMVQNCDTITELPYHIDDVKQSYQFIENEVIEKNFAELSDAVRDTNVFMTEINSRVSDTTTALSDEIQRLVFALFGAIVANLFLILRWSNFDTVIPFSLFVISAILLFYFPLVDQRIDELDEMKSKGKKDYETYKELMSDFSGQAFDFEDLEGRTDEYLSYANERLGWSRRMIRLFHTLLLFAGLFFVGFANLEYEFVSVQVGFSGLFVLTTVYLSWRTYYDPDTYSYHRVALPWEKQVDTGENNEPGETVDQKRRWNPYPLMVTVLSAFIIGAHLLMVA